MTHIFEIWDGILIQLYNICEYIIYIAKYAKIHPVIKKNKRMKNSHIGERCFVVLNGPSINQHDLTRLKDEYVFATNFFYRAPLCGIVKPNMYCWLDSKRLSDKSARDLINEIHETCPEAMLLLNFKAHQFLGEKDYINYVYPKNLSNFFRTRNRLDRISSNYGTVAFLAISTAIYMGFSDIYVLGLDFEPVGFTHFMNLGRDARNSMPGEKFNKVDVAGDYWQYSMAQYQSYYLADMARRQNCHIINLNEKSFIRAFGFANYEDIFKSDK